MCSVSFAALISHICAPPCLLLGSYKAISRARSIAVMSVIGHWDGCGISSSHASGRVNPVMGRDDTIITVSVISFVISSGGIIRSITVGVASSPLSLSYLLLLVSFPFALSCFGAICCC